MFGQECLNKTTTNEYTSLNFGYLFEMYFHKKRRIAYLLQVIGNLLELRKFNPRFAFFKWINTAELKKPGWATMRMSGVHSPL